MPARRISISTTHEKENTIMTTTDPTPSTRNGVDTATLFATLDAVR